MTLTTKIWAASFMAAATPALSDEVTIFEQTGHPDLVQWTVSTPAAEENVLADYDDWLLDPILLSDGAVSKDIDRYAVSAGYGEAWREEMTVLARVEIENALFAAFSTGEIETASISADIDRVSVAAGYGEGWRPEMTVLALAEIEEAVFAQLRGGAYETSAIETVSPKPAVLLGHVSALTTVYETPAP